jgi:NADH dehydrogenase
MILVTGAAGFVGSRLIARLVAEGETPRGLVRDPARAKQRLPETGAEIVQGDTTRPESLDGALQGVDTVIHAAFVTADRKETPSSKYYATNVEGTANLVNAAKRAGVKRIVVAGGLGTRPARPGSYMEGRYLADQSVRTSGLAWSILGPSIQFGAGAAFFNGLADLIERVPLVVPMVGSGRTRLQPIWVEDVVTCLLMMACQPERYDGHAIDVGGPEVYTYAEILDMLMAELGKHKIKVPGPTPFVVVGAAVMEALLPKPPLTVAATGLFSFDNVAARDVVPREFGFTPMSLRTYVAEHGVR